MLSPLSSTYRRLAIAIVLSALAWRAHAASAQAIQFLTPAWVGTPAEDYLRLLQLTGAAKPTSWLMRSGQPELAVLKDEPTINPWSGIIRLEDPRRRSWTVGVFDLSARSTFNSRLPSETNSGALWSGRGISGSLSGGFNLRYGPFRLALAPTLVYSENRPFPLAPLTADQLEHGFTIYANADYTASIDLPQRPGGESLSGLDPGQSAMSIEAAGFALGISTANQWWGPGTFNSVLMTDNAPGIPHLFLSTAPRNIWLGHIEGEWVVGRLFGSTYSTTEPDPSANRRWLNGLGLTFSPRFAPTLYLGAMRLFYRYMPTDGVHLRDLFTLFQPLEKTGLSSPNQFSDAADQMFSLMGRWVFPSSGIELYGEWTRNDHSWDSRDLVLDLTHASGYVIGMQRVLLGDGGFSRIGIESIVLPAPAPGEARDQPTFYIHPQIVQGYTERGRLLGASVGPVGSGQYLRFDRFRSWGRLGGVVSLIQHPDAALGTDASIPSRPAITISGSRVTHGVVWTAAVTYERLLNQHNQPGRDVSNFGIDISGFWRIGSGRQ